MKITGDINPEFERNLVLEITNQRLVMMPVILGAFFFLTYLMAGGSNFQRAFAYEAVFIYTILVFGWAVRSVSEAVVSEVENRTWDFQRMSSIGAWKMTWGKLLGSAIYPWYGAALCLLVYVSVYGSLIDPPSILVVLILLVGGGLLAHAGMFLISLDAVLNGRRASKIFPFLIGAFSLISYPSLISGQINAQSQVAMVWFGVEIPSQTFASASILIYLAWALYGCYRSLQVELAYRTSPNAWTGFLIFLTFYFAGFVPPGPVAKPLRFFVALVVALTATYGALFTEKKNPIKLRKLTTAFKQQDIATLYAQAPKWLISLLLAAFISILFFLSVNFTNWENSLKIVKSISPNTADKFEQGVTSVGYFGLSCIIFAIRDVCLVLILNLLGRGVRRAEKAAVLYLALLYGLIPLIFSALGLGWFNSFLLPNIAGSVVELVILPAIPAAILLGYLLKAWRGEVAKREIGN